MAKTISYSAIVQKNQDRFAVGKRLTRRQFAKMFRVKGIVHEGEYVEVQKSNLTLVGVQAAVNKVLSECGLYLRSRNYYTDFYIVGKEQTKGTILSYQDKSEAHKNASDRLESNMGQRIKAGTWGTYDNSVTPRVSASVSGTKSATRARKQARIKLF